VRKRLLNQEQIAPHTQPGLIKTGRKLPSFN
jgi:hypothetical protein